MRLKVELPTGCEAERRWVVEVLLGRLLGLEYDAVEGAPGFVRISRGDSGVRVADAFFSGAAERWLDAATVPSKLAGTLAPDPDAADSPVDPDVPVLFGKPNADGSWCWDADGDRHVGADLIGGAFFVLSRYEERARPAEDRWGRFPASGSVATTFGFVDRPLVDEYVELLWEELHTMWPDLRRRTRTYRFAPSHDVDHPFRYVFGGYRRWGTCLRADIRGTDSWRRRLGIVGEFAAARLGQSRADPYFTFPFLMRESERLGVRSRFFFFGGRSDPLLDAGYTLRNPRIRRLMRTIVERGHDLGLHPSFATFRDDGQMRREADALRRAAARAGAPEPLQSRQHYLRWSTPKTAQLLAGADVAVDHTLGFPERAGFRCGTSHAFPLFDLDGRRPLALMEQPLIAMDVTVLDPTYEGLGATEKAFERLDRLHRRCRSHGGTFSLLWHNNRLMDPAEQELYLGICRAAA